MLELLYNTICITFFFIFIVLFVTWDNQPLVEYDETYKWFSNYVSRHTDVLWWYGLVSLFNGISTLFRLFNAKAILLEEQ